ncbi:peptide ABC transporter substrate-binding protein [[Clostridium] polysaccharolyticum]|uniref:Oligopeptide transport system substrate-binding protein n=1 Tax=[Clostridium] polysaccharolyticum TaxID=29364 RepID=A0A1I0FQX5_9FIRM|nr:peptide ABC transporter substrate-binding protein [[Clostridium] polysaccharolyticum]SET60573.1 oligopeptide transport system substrate-binding protein [[Clostridium] polysaccharolyticum]
MKKRLVSLVIVTCLAATMLTGCGNKNNSADKDQAVTENAASSDKSTLRINLASEPKYLDPALNTTVDGGCLAVNSFVGLFTTDKDGKVIPALAESYELSDDKLTYTFKLKENLKWSDGTELTAADFEYSWKRAADPETAADYSYLYDVFAKDKDGIIDVKAEGNTLTAKVKVPCTYFLDLLAFPTFLPVPKKAVEVADPDGKNPGAWAQEAGFVSNGAYILESWKHNENMVYVKNPNYYDAENVTVEKLEFMLSADQTAAYAAYKAGDLDFIDAVPNDETASLLNNKEFYVTDQLGTYSVVFNVNSDLFKGKTAEQASKIRQALSLLINRDYIVENVGQTGQKIATSFVPEGMADGNGGIFKSDEYDYPDKASHGYFSEEYDEKSAREEAIALLTEAGYKFDDKGMLDPSTPIAFEYVINEDTGHKAIAESIQQDWNSIGVECTIQTSEWNTFVQDRKAGAFTVARHGWSADFNDPINMLDMWTSTSGNNEAQLGKNPENKATPEWKSYDELIGKINNCTDFAERTTLLHQAEDMLMSTWAICPIYYYNDVYMMKSYVENVSVTPFAMKYFMYAKIS